MKFNFLFIATLTLLMACNSASTEEVQETTEVNPAAEGFNKTASDQKAIDIADEVMLACGGREQWDNTRYIAWNFFGRRMLIWDKHNGNVRINSYPDNTTYLLNVFTNEGKVKRNDVIYDHPDSLKQYVEKGKSIWINDSYWLVMPFKLKDSGVTLSYVDADTTQLGGQADVLALTFKNVGDTPDNKYLVYVGKETRLVEQWDFFTNATDSLPRFSSPWLDYQKYGNILLSSDRKMAKLSEIGVYESLPESVFNSFDPVDLSTLQ